MNNTTEQASPLPLCQSDQEKYFLSSHHILNIWYLLVIVPFYGFVLVVLILFHKQLKSAFFKLAVSAGFADLAWIFIIASLRFQFKADIDENYFSWPWDLILAMLASYLQWTQIIGVLILTFNRFTAIVDPVNYDFKWTVRKIKQSILVQWLAAPALLVIASLLYLIFGEIAWKVYWLAVPLCITLLLITLYSRMVCQYRHQRADNISVNSSKETKADMRLALIGGTLSCFYICMSLRYFVLALELLGENGLFSMKLLCDVDFVLIHVEEIGEALFVSSNPFMFILFSSEVRKYSKRLLMGRKKKNNHRNRGRREARGSRLSAPSISVHRSSNDSVSSFFTRDSIQLFDLPARLNRLSLHSRNSRASSRASTHHSAECIEEV